MLLIHRESPSHRLEVVDPTQIVLSNYQACAGHGNYVERKLELKIVISMFYCVIEQR